MSTEYKSSIPQSNESIWIATTQSTNYPPLEKDMTVDVVIVGGGIAGITTATLLKEKGLSVAVLEARKIVQGVTGYTTAKITSLHDLIYDYLISNFGQEKAQMYANANGSAIEKIASLVKKHRIDCDFLRKSAYTYTTKEKSIKEMQKEVKAAERLGIKVHHTEDVPLPLPIKAAVYFTNQAQFHPRNYLLALAQEIQGGGSYIFEQTRAVAIDETDRHCTVTTTSRKITAKYVVIATHAPFLDKGQFYTRMIQQRSYVLGLKLTSTPPPDMYISIEEPFHSFRTQTTKDGDIFFIGGEDHKAGQGGNTWKHYEKLASFAKKYFNVKSIKYRWSTQDNMPIDKVPYIGKWPLSKRTFVATGFNGWGMTNGTVSAMILTDMILGKKNEWAPVFDPTRIKPVTAGTKLIKENIDTGVHMVKDRLRKPSLDNVEKLPKGEGIVVRKGLQEIAIYKEESGQLREISAVCTHMGCVVGWNSAEKSWDCPCHGSRFAVDGSVIQGPANVSLKPVTDGEDEEEEEQVMYCQNCNCK